MVKKKSKKLENDFMLHVHVVLQFDLIELQKCTKAESPASFFAQ